VVSKLIFVFRGMPLLLGVCLGLARSILSWVCDKPGFNGRVCSGDSSVGRGMSSSSRIKIEKFNDKKNWAMEAQYGGPSVKNQISI
jgi:hypothetical protein